jgi:hypothetical protein
MAATGARRMFGLALAGLVLPCSVAYAMPFSITTTGTITSGSDPANLLGAGMNLVGDSYVLTVNYDGLGPSYYTDGSGTLAEDLGDPILSSISVTIGANTTTTALTANTATSLVEDAYDLESGDSGNDAANDFAHASQLVSSANGFIPVADLQTPFSYTLEPNDLGQDEYSLSNAANTDTASFSGTTTSVEFTTVAPAATPEPAAWMLLGTGLLGFPLALKLRKTAYSA